MLCGGVDGSLGQYWMDLVMGGCTSVLASFCAAAASMPFECVRGGSLTPSHLAASLYLFVRLVWTLVHAAIWFSAPRLPALSSLAGSCTTTDWPHLFGLVHLPLSVARGDARGAEGHHRGPHWQGALRVRTPATSLCLFCFCHVSHSHGQPYRLAVIIFFHRYDKKNHLGIHRCGRPHVTCPGAPCLVPVVTLACLLGHRHRTDATVVVRRGTEHAFTPVL